MRQTYTSTVSLIGQRIKKGRKRSRFALVAQHHYVLPSAYLSTWMEQSYLYLSYLKVIQADKSTETYITCFPLECMADYKERPGWMTELCESGSRKYGNFTSQILIRNHSCFLMTLNVISSQQCKKI